MDDKFLFYDEIPKGIKTIYFNGKRITREEFLIKKKNSLIKKMKLRHLVEIIFIVLSVLFVYFFFKK